MTGLASSARIPVTLITGFLGSGKTTLINAVLRNTTFSGTLVIVNEFGEVGVDHLLVGNAKDQVVLLESGCLCCAASGSLRDTLIDLFARQATNAVEPFTSIFVETSGLAHPGPLVATLIGDSSIRNRCRLAQVLTLADGITGLNTLDKYPEARYQIAFADRLAITKTDQACKRATQELADALHALNPNAPLSFWNPSMPSEPLFANKSGNPSVPAWTRISSWFSDPAATASDTNTSRADAPGPFLTYVGGKMRHVLHRSTYQRVRTHTLHFGRDPMSWDIYAAWTQTAMARLGRKFLRCKGILHMNDGYFWVVQGVQGYFAPPERLPVGGDEPPHGFLVCIVDSVPPEELAAIAADIPGFPECSYSPALQPSSGNGHA